MILLLVVAIAVVAVLAYAGNRITRSRAQQRRESEARARMKAEAAQAARARAEDARHRPVRNEDDALTHVMPAIKLPWSAASPLADRRDDGYSGYSGGTSYNPHTVFADEYPQASFGGNGYARQASPAGYTDLDADYPAFSTGTPFQADEEPPAPAPEPAEYGQAAGYRPAAQYPPPPAGPAGPLGEAAGNGTRFGELRSPPAYPADRFGLGSRPGEAAMPAPRPGDYDIPRSRPAERLAPAARPGEQHDAARRRAGQGSHRAGHAKRRRG